MKQLGSVVLKLVLEIDGKETIIRQIDYTESINERIPTEDDCADDDDSYWIKNVAEVHESILEDIAIGEAL